MGLMMVAFAAGTVTTGFAQDGQAEKEAIYKKFTDNFNGKTVEQRKIAIEAGKEYLQKYEADNDEVVAYIKRVLPKVEKSIEGDVSAESKAFNEAVPAKNWDAAFTNGKAILSKAPDNIDVMLVLASIGFDNSVANPPVDKYNTDAINFAKMAIQKIEEGKPSGTQKYGAFAYEYKTDKFPDGKSNALGWMNYTIGSIMFNRLNQKKEALPYLYKATQANSATKNFAEIYRLIGSYYLNEYNNIVTDRNAKIQANGGKETEETRAALGMQYAYADRAIDAYAIAHKIANANPAEKAEYKTALLNTAKQAYKARFGKDEGADAYIATQSSKSLVDPGSAVTPVSVESLAPETPSTTDTPTTTASPSTTGTPQASPSASPKTTGSPTASPKASPSTSATPKPSPSTTKKP